MECSICFASCSPFISRCNHTFCHPCMMQWLTLRNTCPMCRFKLDASNRDTQQANEPRLKIRFCIEHHGMSVANQRAGFRTIMQTRQSELVSALVDYLLIRNGRQVRLKGAWRTTKRGIRVVIKTAHVRWFVGFRYEAGTLCFAISNCESRHRDNSAYKTTKKTHARSHRSRLCIQNSRKGRCS